MVILAHSAMTCTYTHGFESPVNEVSMETMDIEGAMAATMSASIISCKTIIETGQSTCRNFDILYELCFQIIKSIPGQVLSQCGLINSMQSC
jgi:hypothetical protein